MWIHFLYPILQAPITFLLNHLQAAPSHASRKSRGGFGLAAVECSAADGLLPGRRGGAPKPARLRARMTSELNHPGRGCAGRKPQRADKAGNSLA